MNWSLCCLCQDNLKSAELRSTKDGLQKFSEQLIKFKEAGVVLRETYDHYSDSTSLLEYFQKNKAHYHKKCYNDYNDEKLDRLKKSIASLTNNNTRKDARKRSTDCQLGELRCAICTNYDSLGQLHMVAEAKRKKATEVEGKAHLQQKTKEWWELAETPGYENLHSKICVGDLKSNEVFYHNKCWVKLKRDTEAYKKGTSQNEFDAILKFKQDYCMRNVYQYVYETYENPLTYVELRAIFKRYKCFCETNNVPVDPNITRFRNSFEKFMSDDLEIMKPGKTLCVGWAKGIKEADVSAMTKSDT